MELKSSLLRKFDKISSEVFEDYILDNLNDIFDEESNFNFKFLLNSIQIRYPQLNHFLLISLMIMLLGFSIYNNDLYGLSLGIMYIS